MNWKDNLILSTICPIIILILQVFSAISDIFPFKNRKDELRELMDKLQDIYIEMENDFRLYQKSAIDDRTAQKKLFDYEKRIEEIKNNYLKNDVLPITKSFRKKADDYTDEYFKNFK